MIETIKKFGAGLIILILVAMMALVFGNQPVDEITRVLAGNPGAGKFQKEVIDLQIYSMIESNCKQNFLQQFGVAPEGMINSCVNSNLKQLYILPAVARELGLDVSREYVEQAALKRAQDSYRLQRTGKGSEDDVLSVSELYQRELSYYPFDLQHKSATIERVQETLGREFAASPEEIALRKNLGNIRFRLRILSYTAGSLEETTQKTIKVTEEDIRKAYEEEQKKLPPDKQKPFESEKQFVKERITKDMVSAGVAATKKQLGNLSGSFSLEDVEKITGFAAKSAGAVAANELRAVKVGGGSVNLMSKDILLFLGRGKPGVAGPFQEQEQTIYLELVEVDQKDPAPATAEEIKLAGQENARTFLSYVMEQEGQAGKFAVYAPRQ
ncbi:MAG: hypothetical protein HS115_13805 [Spirochaetales bacterium]|nr:hypothetical protein [Spirochaetales bacterium]